MKDTNRISKTLVFDILFTEHVRCKKCNKFIKLNKKYPLTNIRNLLCRKCKLEWIHYGNGLSRPILLKEFLEQDRKP